MYLHDQWRCGRGDERARRLGGHSDLGTVDCPTLTRVRRMKSVRIGVLSELKAKCVVRE